MSTTHDFAATAGQPVWQSAAVAGDAMRRAGEIITGPFAQPLIAAAGFPPSSLEDLVILDNACGSGVIAATLLGLLDKEQKRWTKVTCGDVQQGMIDHVRTRAEKEHWEGVEIKLVDAQDTQLPSSHYTHVLTAFAIMLVPKPLAALQEIHRILVPGGMNGFTTWNKVGWVPLVERAFAAIPGCPPFPGTENISDFMGTGRWDTPAFIKQQLEEQGFVDVHIEVKDELSTIDSSENFVRLFGGMFIGLATKWFTEEQKQEFGEKIKETLLSQLQEEHGAGQPWDMPLTANVVTCRKPVK